MTKPALICVDDQREVLSSLLHDLEDIAAEVQIVDCESAAEALEAIEELDAEGVPIALVVSDHVMPEKTGVEFLTELREDGRFAATKKMLLTGLATQDDTIEAINAAKIDLYVAKPWKRDALLSAIRKLVTDYIFDVDLDYRDFDAVIDPDTLIARQR